MADGPGRCQEFAHAPVAESDCETCPTVELAFTAQWSFDPKITGKKLVQASCEIGTMRVCVIFYNLGGYHLARLRASFEACIERGWKFSAIEIVRSTSEHPWGNAALPDYVTTLMQFQKGSAPSLPDAKLLKSVLDQIAPDTVVIPGWGFDFSRVALRWAKWHGSQAVLMSESKKDDVPRGWWKELIKKHCYVKHFDSALVGGSRHRNYMVELGMDNNRIFCGYDVVDNEYFIRQTDLIRAADTIDLGDHAPKRPFFLAINRFIPRKNLRFLIEAFAVFEERAQPHQQYDLVLLGSGQGLGELKHLVRSLGLADRIFFPGFVSYDSICLWYSAASVFIHPAFSEQWGLVVNEAMASQLPVLVSSACGCMPDLMREGESGFSFSPTDCNDLVAKMLRLTECPERARKMGQTARMVIQQDHNPRSFGTGLISAIQCSVR